MDYTNQVIGAAIKVHMKLGPGLLESCYQKFLFWECLDSGLVVEKEKRIPIEYKGRTIKDAFRIDLLVESKLVIEIKSVSELSAIHEAQVLTYLKLCKIRVGLLINFNEYKLKYGIKRLVLD